MSWIFDGVGLVTSAGQDTFALGHWWRAFIGFDPHPRGDFDCDRLEAEIRSVSHE